MLRSTTQTQLGYLTHRPLSPPCRWSAQKQKTGYDVPAFGALERFSPSIQCDFTAINGWFERKNWWSMIIIRAYMHDYHHVSSTLGDFIECYHKDLGIENTCDRRWSKKSWDLSQENNWRHGAPNGAKQNGHINATTSSNRGGLSIVNESVEWKASTYSNVLKSLCFKLIDRNVTFFMLCGFSCTVYSKKSLGSPAAPQHSTPSYSCLMKTGVGTSKSSYSWLVHRY